MAVSFLAALVTYNSRPIRVTDFLTPEFIQTKIGELSPVDSIKLFRNQQENGLNPAKSPEEKRFETLLSRFHAWLGIMIALFAVGLVLLIVGTWERVAKRRAG